MLGTVGAQLGVLQLGALWAAGTIPVEPEPEPAERLDVANGSYVRRQVVTVGSSVRVMGIGHGAVQRRLPLGSGSVE